MKFFWPLWKWIAFFRYLFWPVPPSDMTWQISTETQVQLGLSWRALSWQEQSSIWLALACSSLCHSSISPFSSSGPTKTLFLVKLAFILQIEMLSRYHWFWATEETKEQLFHHQDHLHCLVDRGIFRDLQYITFSLNWRNWSKISGSWDRCPVSSHFPVPPNQVPLTPNSARGFWEEWFSVKGGISATVYGTIFNFIWYSQLWPSITNY